MRIWGLTVLVLVTAAAAQAAEFPETHLLLVDRHTLRLADKQDDDAHFAATAKSVYRQLLARHGANLILDSSAAPAHWSGLDVTTEAVASLHPAASEPTTVPTAAPFVRMLFADIAPSESSDPKFHETLEHIAAGQGATLVVDRKAVVISAAGFDVTALVRSSLETYRNSGTLPLVVGGPDVPPAHVAVLDRTALVRGSAAGRSIAEQLRAIALRNMDYLRGEDSVLANLRERLKARLASLSPEGRAKALQDYSDAQKRLRAEAQDRQNTFNAAAAQAQKKLDAVAGPIVLRLLNDGHANVMLDKMAVVANDDALDITTPAVEALNAALLRIEVVLPAQK